MTGVVGSWNSGFFSWFVADWHALTHIAPPLVLAGVDLSVGGFGDLGLSWVDASFDSVAETGEIAVNFDGISFAALVWINPVESVVDGGTDFLGGKVEIQASSGW